MSFVKRRRSTRLISRRKLTEQSAARKMRGGAFICDKLRAQHNLLQILRIQNDKKMERKRLSKERFIGRRILKVVLLLFIGINKSLRILCSRPDIRVTASAAKKLNLPPEITRFGLYSADVLKAAKHMAKADTIHQASQLLNAVSPSERENIIKNQLSMYIQPIDRLFLTGFGVTDPNLIKELRRDVPAIDKFIEFGLSENTKSVQKVTNIISAALRNKTPLNETVQKLNDFVDDMPNTFVYPGGLQKDNIRESLKTIKTIIESMANQ